MFVGVLKEIRGIADEYSDAFQSEGFTTFFAMLKRELAASRATWKVIAADQPLGLVSSDSDPTMRSANVRPARLDVATPSPT